jgi:hypothetical protein
MCVCVCVVWEGENVWIAISPTWGEEVTSTSTRGGSSWTSAELAPHGKHCFTAGIVARMAASEVGLAAATATFTVSESSLMARGGELLLDRMMLVLVVVVVVVVEEDEGVVVAASASYMRVTSSADRSTQVRMNGGPVSVARAIAPAIEFVSAKPVGNGFVSW